MMKKAVLLVLFAAFVIVLVAGAVNRTMARADMSAGGEGRGQESGEGHGEGHGQGEEQGQGEEHDQGEGNDHGQGQGEGQGQGQSQGQGQGRSLGDGEALSGGHGQGQGQGQGNGLGLAGSSAESRVGEWLTVEGVVVSVDDSEMILRVGEGSDIMVEGRPWQFATEQGFAPAVGDEVTVVGFHEDGEFKAGRIDNNASGQSVTLRAQDGRPGWSGRGRRQQEASQGN